MRLILRGCAVLAVACVFALSSRALAAPERLGDLVPDAVPDHEGAWAFAWGREAIHLEGPLNDEQTARDYFKLRYTFSPKVNASFKYTYNDMVGGFGLVSPVLNDIDSAGSYSADIGMNLMHQPRVDADAAKQVAFAAGSSFGIGVTGTQFKLKTGTLSQDETMIAAYLLYSTDLTEEMRAHTYFSSGRLSGDAYTGSVNRVGAGLDYALIPGKRPLDLLVNGVLDVYNFRQPSFNTNRVSRFDVGLRYRVARDWYATLGWATVNDSENNNSGSGLFGSINYSQMPKEKKECLVPETPPADAPPAAPPAADAAPAGLPLADLGQPALMASAAPAAPPSAELPPTGFRETAVADGTGDKAAASAQPELDAAPASDNGIEIPALPDPAPQHTPAGAVMLRAGVAEKAAPPQPARSTALMLRPPVAAGIATSVGKLVSDLTGSTPGGAAKAAEPPPVAEEESAGVMEIAALPPTDGSPAASAVNGPSASSTAADAEAQDSESTSGESEPE